MNPARSTVAALWLTVAVAVAACDTGGSVPATTGTTPTVESPVSVTGAAPAVAVATSSPAPSWEPRQAIRYMWDFDPAAGDPDELAEALRSADLSPGLELPILVEEGTDAVREVVFAKLAEPHGWSVPLLVEMLEYGMPSGTRDSPKPWPDAIVAVIEETLDATANASYGPCAELMIDLNWHHITEQVDRCGDGCEWGPVWYAVPEAVVDPVGDFVDDTRFEGIVTLASDTGAGDPSLVAAERLDRWTITERAASTDAAAADTPNVCRAPSG